MSLKISQMTAAGSITGAELLEVSQLSASVTVTAATISALASDNSYNDSGSGFVSAGFAVDDTVKVTGFTGNVANNISSGTVTTLTAGKMTIGGSDGGVIVDDAAGESVTITKWETRRAAASSLAAAGGGDVTAASSMTDHAVVRGDGGVKGVQTSGVLIDDSDHVSGMASLTLTNTGLHLLDTNATHDLIIAPGSNLTADRTLTVTTGDSDRTLTLNGNATISGTNTGDTAGKHAIWVAAGSITPSATGGCAALATIASAANQPDIQTLDFDTTTQEYAQFSIRMPKSWDEGTVTFVPEWSHAATVTNFGVVWDLQGVAISDDDAIPAAFGTAQTSADTGGTTNDAYAGPESSAITIAGSPAAEDWVCFRVSRVTGNGSDTMAIDARLHGLTLYITTNAENDA